MSPSDSLVSFPPQIMSRVIKPRRTELWTSAKAAHAFRVGVSSVKRWTDEGELESVRTPGNHRRYTAVALHRFASTHKLPIDRLPPLTVAEEAREVPPPAEVPLFDALLHGDEIAVRQLVRPRVRSLAQRAAFFDRVVGDAMREIGFRWEGGALSVEQEHRATRMITEAIDLQRPRLSRGSRIAMLACPPSEDHELPLHMLRLLLEWRGWQTSLTGARIPWDSMHLALDRDRPWLLALTARRAEAFENDDFAELVSHCQRQRTVLVVGGSWARGGAGEVKDYERFRTLRGFERWLRAFPND